MNRQQRRNFERQVKKAEKSWLKNEWSGWEKYILYKPDGQQRTQEEVVGVCDFMMADLEDGLKRDGIPIC